jgi:hypothetical protein
VTFSLVPCRAFDPHSRRGEGEAREAGRAAPSGGLQAGWTPLCSRLAEGRITWACAFARFLLFSVCVHPPSRARRVWWRSPACCVPDAVWQTQWANQRLQKVLGQDVSEVCEYLVNIEVCCVRWFAPCPHWSASAPPLPRGPRARLSRLPAHHPVWCVGQPHLPAALAPRPMRARRDEAHDAAHDAQTGRRRAARVR